MSQEVRRRSHFFPVASVGWCVACSLAASDGRPVMAQVSKAPKSAVVQPAVKLPERAPIEFKLVKKLDAGPNKENSGVVKSRQQTDVYWMHNDSGDEPRVYAVHRDGTNYVNSRSEPASGVLIGGAINVDWEDIAVDSDGHLIVADLGNNGNDRRDLVLYYLHEPAATAGRTTLFQKIFVRYPDQRHFPAKEDNFNFDCEAIFTVKDTVYCLSKNRSDSLTKLYRLDKPRPDVTNVLTHVETFDIQGQAVGADCSVDGKRLVVLTYTAVWLFERSGQNASFFGGKIRWAPFPKRDAEAICFADDEHLLVADESTSELYELKISDMSAVE